MKHVRGARILLNLPGHQSSAALVAEVEDSRTWKQGCGRDGKRLTKERSWQATPEVIFQISDCSRAITLDFDSWDSEEDRRNHLHKADALVDVLTQFRDALADELRLYEERKP